MLAMILEWRGVEQREYDAVIEALELGGKTYKGGVFHVAGPMDGGWRVVDVWESQEAFDAFLRDKLGPVSQRLGVPAPQITAWPVHNTLTPTGPARAAQPAGTSLFRDQSACPFRASRSALAVGTNRSSGSAISPAADRSSSGRSRRR